MCLCIHFFGNTIIDSCDVEIGNLTNDGKIYLSSPLYPQNYPTNIDCFYIFSETIPGTYVITVVDVETEFWDKLMIGHSYDIGEDTMDVELSLWFFPKTILVPDLVMWVRFTSNHAVTFRGFLLEIERTTDAGKWAVFHLWTQSERNRE